MKEREVSHAVELLAKASKKGWLGPVAIVEADPVCRFDAGDGPCNQEIRHAVALQEQGLGEPRSVSILVLCDHHADIMAEAVIRYRQVN